MSASGVVIRRPLPESHPPVEVGELVVVVLLDAPPRPLADAGDGGGAIVRRYSCGVVLSTSPSPRRIRSRTGLGTERREQR